MPATFTCPLVTVIAGQTITASERNAELDNIYDNFIPAGMDDYSASDSEMQTQEDPFPGGSTSRPTSLQGELTRIRYQIAAITGNSYWYQDPPAIFANFSTHTHDGTSGQGPQIDTAGLADGAVETAKINDSAVTTAKIADSNVTTAKIADSNVTTAKIADANVTSAKLASSLDIATLNVTTALNWAGFSTLKILQIVKYTSATSFSTALTTFQDTGIGGSITPQINTSKILVFVSGHLAVNGSAVGYATIYRGSTNLATTDGGLAFVAANASEVTMLAYDSPATTSATSYKVRIRTNNGLASVFFPTTDGGIYTSDAVMLLVEVAQ